MFFLYLKLKSNTYYMSTQFHLSKFKPDINNLVKEHQIHYSH